MSGYGFKSQLKEALESAVGYFQDGGDPNAACVKAANEAGFNADQADRLVETFNTARVICHYKAAEDKTSSCSLADKETVRSQLTAKPEEKSAERNFRDYDFYKHAEVDHVIRQTKEAEFELKEDPISKEAKEWLRVRKETTLKELAKEASEQARATYALADEIAEKVAIDMSRDVDIAHVHDRMARMVRAYALDERYAPGVEKVAAFLPTASDPDDISHLLKYASAHIVDTSDLNDVMPRVKEASDLVAEASALEAYVADILKEAQAVDNSDLAGKSGPELKDLLTIEQIKGERARNAAGTTAGNLSKEKGIREGGKPSGGGGSGGTKGLVAYLVDGWRQRRDSEFNARIGKATDGVNNVRRQLILQDLLARDKVLSQEDPDSVIQAFRSVHQVSPDSTLNKEVLRSMLRSVVQSVAISPFDAKALADLDKARRQAYTATPEGGNSHA